MDTDCVVIGAGPAGLMCGVYLGRYLRSVVIFHCFKSRAEWIPVTHNYPGFLEGITGPDMLKLLHRQAEMYGAIIRQERVCEIRQVEDGFIVRTTEGETSTGKIVIATGVQDIPPDIPNAVRFKGTTIRHCPICDAYEARGKKIVVFGWDNHAFKETLWLSHYTSDLILLTTGHASEEHVLAKLQEDLAERNIRTMDQKVVRIEEDGPLLGTIYLDDGSKIEHVFRGYSAMGLKANSELAASVGVVLDEHGYIKVKGPQRTSVEGIYAVGDIVSGQVAQISVAVGNAASAATAIHNSLLKI